MVSLPQVYSPYNESETKEDRGFVDLEESFVDDLVKVLDNTKDEVSATKVLDSSVATGGKAVNIWWDGGWTGNVALTMASLAAMDIQVAIFSIIVVAAIIILNTGSLLLCLAGNWPPFELNTLLPPITKIDRSRVRATLCQVSFRSSCRSSSPCSAGCALARTK